MPCNHKCLKCTRAECDEDEITPAEIRQAELRDREIICERIRAGEIPRRRNQKRTGADNSYYQRHKNEILARYHRNGGKEKARSYYQAHREEILKYSNDRYRNRKEILTN